jgi:uncharacterized protein (DUF4415 family)
MACSALFVLQVDFVLREWRRAMIRKEAKWTTQPSEVAKHARLGDAVEVMSDRGELVMRARQPKRGRPSTGKQVVSIRLEPDVLAKFKATGSGWQSRINDALKAAKL